MRPGSSADKNRTFPGKSRAPRPAARGKNPAPRPAAAVTPEAYQKELKAKEEQVRRLIGPFGTVQPITGMEDPMHYRNKVSAAFGMQKGQIVSGIYRPGTHQILPQDSSLLEDEKADEIIVAIRNLCRSFKIRPFDEDTGTGLLRHVLIRTGKRSGQIMVVLVTASPVFPGSRNFVRVLLEQFPEITTVVQDINTRTDSMVLSGRQKVLWGKGYIEDELCGKIFRISPSSFYQVNPVQTEKLYARAVKYAGLTGREVLLDAYCGIGTIGIVAAEHAASVIGVELNEAAVKDARINAERNGAENVRFYCDDAGQFLRKMRDAGERTDVVIMDPPRAGGTEEFIDCVAYMRPKTVVYVSCNPVTLARDLKIFEEKGYRMRDAAPFDCFPFTEHVETVCLLTRN